MKSHFDRERRRTKTNRWKWATRLVKPITLKGLIAVGIWVFRAIWIIDRIIKLFRE